MPLPGLFQRPSVPTVSDALQAYVLKLQPIFLERRRVTHDPRLPAEARERYLQLFERQVRQAGLAEFSALLTRVCHTYCRNRQGGIHFDPDQFASEVLLLALDRLDGYDPDTARFSTWLSSTIFPCVYSAMQRQTDPTWGRPAAKTAWGQRRREQAQALARVSSLDQMMLNQDRPLSDTVSDDGPPVEQNLLEEHCRERFLAAVDQLSDGERVLLRRVHVQGEPQKEIATTLGITSAAVCLRMKKIHRKLFDLLGQDFEHECGDSEFCDVLRRNQP